MTEHELFIQEVLRDLRQVEQECRAAVEEFTRAEREEYNAILDQEHDEYWSNHCPEHGEALDSVGHCTICEAELAEERRIDR